MNDVILGALISTASASIGIILQFISRYIIDKKKKKMETLAYVYNKRLTAYENIYGKLFVCKNLYLDILRTVPSKNKREWFYKTISIIDECFEIYQENEIYYERETSDFLYLKFRVTDALNQDIQSASTEELMKISSDNAAWIKEALIRIRKDIRVDELNKIV